MNLLDLARQSAANVEIKVTLAIGYHKLRAIVGQGQGGHWEEVDITFVIDRSDLIYDEVIVEKAMEHLPGRATRQDLAFVHLLNWENGDEKTGDKPPTTGQEKRTTLSGSGSG